MDSPGDADESADDDFRYCGDLGGGAQARSAGGGGQHVYVAVLPEADRAGRRHGDALDDEVFERALGRARWSAGVHDEGAGGRAGVHPEVAGRDPVAVRELAHPAGREDAGGPDGEARRERTADCRLPGRSQEGEESFLSRTTVASTT